MKNRLPYIFLALTLIILGAIFISLYKGVSIPTAIMQTKLLNKPLPTVKVANLYDWKEMYSLKSLTDLPKENSPIGRWYLINFWASWCELCVEEHPFLMDLSSQGVVIYGFNFEDKLDSAKTMLTNQGNPYALTFWDARGIAGSALGIYTIPETFLVDPNGIIRYSLIDPLTKNIWEKTFLPIINNATRE